MSIESLIERINKREFKNKIPFPDDIYLTTIPNYFACKSKIIQFHKNIEKLRNSMEEIRRDLRKKYSEGEAEAVQLFQKALEEEFGMVGHPKAQKIWEYAWDRGHSDGYSEILIYYEEAVDLIK